MYGLNYKLEKKNKPIFKSNNHKKKKIEAIQFGFVLVFFPLFFILKDVLVSTCWDQLHSSMSVWPFQYHIKEQSRKKRNKETILSFYQELTFVCLFVVVFQVNIPLFQEFLCLFRCSAISPSSCRSFVMDRVA